jgi:2'-5' RNA ligase
VFFALWPDDSTRAAIVRATKEAVRLSGGRPIAKDRLHITVAFLGNLSAAGFDVAREVPPIRTGAFDLALDAIGHFAQGKVLWLGATTVPQPLVALESELWAELEARGFVREARAFHPHVTLARRARPVEQRVDAIPWRAAELALVESLADGRNVHYEKLESWPL